MLDTTKIRASRTDYGMSIDLYGFRGRDDKFAVARPLEMVSADRFEVHDPFVRLKPDEAQGLMDSLWDCGLRPSEGAGSAGALAATQNHLDDMRKIVFNQKFAGGPR